MSAASLRRDAWLADPRVLAALLAAYLAAHFGLRLAVNPTLALDDAEQALFTQHWAWGYQLRQPPLYTWLLLPVAEAVGTGVVAISILRYALFGLYLVVFHMAARRWIGTAPRLASTSPTTGCLSDATRRAIWSSMIPASHAATPRSCGATTATVSSTRASTDRLSEAAASLKWSFARARWCDSAEPTWSL